MQTNQKIMGGCRLILKTYRTAFSSILPTSEVNDGFPGGGCVMSAADRPWQTYKRKLRFCDEQDLPKTIVGFTRSVRKEASWSALGGIVKEDTIKVDMRRDGRKIEEGMPQVRPERAN